MIPAFTISHISFLTIITFTLLTYIIAVEYRLFPKPLCNMTSHCPNCGYNNLSPQKPKGAEDIPRFCSACTMQLPPRQVRNLPHDTLKPTN
jgi:hypothetical protein